MSLVVVTGSSGLVGSEVARLFHTKGMDVLGIDNDLRASFFGGDGSTDWNRKKLESELPRYTHHSIDIRDQEAVFRLFRQAGRGIVAVIHTAAQPSHDWAAKEPFTDFSVN